MPSCIYSSYFLSGIYHFNEMPTLSGTQLSSDSNKELTMSKNIEQMRKNVDKYFRAMDVRAKVRDRWLKKSFAKQQPYEVCLKHLEKAQRWNTAVDAATVKFLREQKELSDLINNYHKVADTVPLPKFLS